MADIKLLKQIIQNDELITAEFKASRDELARSVYESICAFLNRKGGHIFLGVRNDRTIEGINPDNIRTQLKTLTQDLNNPQLINPPCNITPEHLQIDGKDIIFMYVPESAVAHTYKGQYYDRNFEGDFILRTQHQIANLLLRKQKESYVENRVFPNLTIEDFDHATFEEARIAARNNSKTGEHLWTNMTDDELLKSAGMWHQDAETGKWGYTLAAVLLFGKQPTIFSVAPQYNTDVLCRIDDTDLYDDREIVRCNLIQAYPRIMAFLAKYLPEKPYMEGDHRISLREVIFREIVQNILIHREFSNGYKASVTIYADRVETKNWNIPYQMGKISLDNLAPQPKNQVIARVFQEMGLAEELGRGTRNLFKYCPVMTPGRMPVMIEDDVFTTIIPIDIPGKTAAVSTQDSASSTQVAEKVHRNDDEGSQKVHRKFIERHPDLSSAAINTLVEISGNHRIRIHEIAEHLGISSRAVSKQLSKLKEKGLIERIGGDRGGYWKVND